MLAGIINKDKISCNDSCIQSGEEKTFSDKTIRKFIKDRQKRDLSFQVQLGKYLSLIFYPVQYNSS